MKTKEVSMPKKGDEEAERAEEESMAKEVRSMQDMDVTVKK